MPKGACRLLIVRPQRGLHSEFILQTSLIVFAWCCVLIREQRDREGPEDVTQGNGIVATFEGLPGLILKDRKPLFGRFLGENNPGLLSRIYRDEPAVGAEKSASEARHNDEAPVSPETASKRNHTVLMGSLDMHRNVVAFQQQRSMTLSKLQAMFHDVHFDSAIFPICKQAGECDASVLEACKHFLSFMKVNGLAVVGIHQAEVPRFGSLVKICYAG